MSRPSWAVLLAVAALGCTHPTPRSQQLDALKHYTPSALVAAPMPDAGRGMVVKVLALVDDDYRQQVPSYEAEIVRQFREASAYTVSELGTRFEVVAIEAWAQRAGNRPLSEVLRALEQQPLGEGFDVVAGFVSSLPVVVTNHDDMGMARLLGKHMVIRGIDDAAEFVEVRKEFRAVHDAELEAFHRQRKHHKQTTLLLHEWGHCLGAIHDTDSHSVMLAAYSIRENGFSRHSLPILKASLEGGDLGERAKRVRQALERLGPEPFYAKDHAQWVGELRALEQGPAAPPAAQLTRAEVDRFNLAVKLFNASMYVEANRQLEPLVARLPSHGLVRAMSCQLAIAMAPDDPQTVRGCEEGAQAAKGSARPLVTLAQARLAAKNPQGAVEALEAAALLASSVETEAEAWLAIASIARQALCVSLADHAAGRAAEDPGVDAIKEWTSRTRRWMGLSSASPKCEREHVERFREAQLLLGRDQLAAAARRITWFPAGPGRDGLACELALRKGALRDARRACEQALAAWPEATLARYLLGVISEAERRPAEVEQHLARVVELDPSIDDAYVRLAAALRTLGKKDELDRLKTRFEAQFKRPLR